MDEQTKVRMQKVDGVTWLDFDAGSGSSHVTLRLERGAADELARHLASLATEFDGDASASYVTVRDMAATVSRR